MMTVLIILSVLAIHLLKGIADTIQTDPDYRENGWKAKWKVFSSGHLRKMDYSLEAHRKMHWWYCGLIRPEYEEKFPFSSEALVSLTDRWHFVNFLQYRIIHAWLTYILVVANNYNYWWLFALLVLPLIGGAGFRITFKR